MFSFGKMTSRRQFLLLVVIFFLCYFNNTESAKRTKRELRFPKGASFLTAVALASFLPKGITDGIAHVLEFDWGFPFPEDFAFNKVDIERKDKFPTWKKSYITSNTKNEYVSKNKYIKKTRVKRNLKEEQRKELLYRIEYAITSLGHNGSSCVSRFQCEIQRISPNSLMEELLSTLFNSSQRLSDNECETFQQFCSFSLLHAVLHSEQMFNSPT